MKNGLEAVQVIQNERAPEIVEEPSFIETVGSTLKYRYDPLIDFIDEVNRFGYYDQPDPNFSAMDSISDDLKPYATTLLRAKNQQHLDYLETQLRDSLNTRETLNQSGFMPQLGAEFFDPINYIALPFARGRTAFQKGLSTGRGTATIVAGQEAIRYPLDPLATPSEVGFNVGSAFAFGTALGTLTNIPMTRRARAIRDAEIEIENFRKLMDTDDASIAPNLFTDSWLYKSATTPMKRVLQDPDIPESVKVTTLEIANDAGILLAANKKGKAFKPSVFQNAKLLEGEMVQSYDQLLSIWGKSTGRGVTSAMDYVYKRSDFEEWLESVDAKAMQGIKPADDFESQAMSVLNNFYDRWETRLREEGMIGDTPFYRKDIARRERAIEVLQDKLGKAKDRDYIDQLSASIRRHEEEIAHHQAVMEELSQMGKIIPHGETLFRPRYWDRDVIKANREEFEEILYNWFKDNPATIQKMVDGKLQRVELAKGDAAIKARVAKMTDDLLGMGDPADIDVGYFGMGKSKHMKHRVVDIPNERVLKFINTNPVQVMKAYTARVGSRYEFSRQFGGRSIDELLDEKMIEMLEAGVSKDKAYATLRDMRHLYERVAGSVIREPDSWDFQTAQVLRDLAQLNYLGSAGISTMTEPAKIIMEHGLGPTMRGLFSVMKDSQLKMGAKEVRIAGEALEILQGSAHMRLVDDLSNNPLKNTVFDKAKNAFYLLNGLAPITRIFKDFDAMMRSHTLIDYSVRLTKGKATQMEIEYLARYGIDANEAKKIANAPWRQGESGLYIANTEAWTNTIEFPATTAEIVSGPTNSYAGKRYKPAFYRKGENKIYVDEEYIKDVMYQERGWENPRVEGVKPIPKGIINSPEDYVTFIKMHEIMHSLHSAKSLGIKDARSKEGKAAYENAINDLAIKEIQNQPRVSEDTVRKFRVAMSSGVANTILMGTPADKPIITDGVAYIPMRVARQFGMKEDSKYKGYARVESGLLGLPFQFYSYSLAAVNKITAAHAHGQVKNQFLGLAISMGLGYAVLQYKTPDFVDMSFQDQLARSFDLSGTAALYTDLLYTGMSTSLALGGPNITNGFLQPRFPQEPNAADAATGLLGAGPSIATDYARGMADIVTGNVGEGTKEIIRNLPFARMWFWKGKMNEFTRMLETDLDGITGFGRY
jgi:hypothetical protein